jgi:transcription initiation factor TFIIIB Brf1 subunit/transcription initiation factor TFIIB
MIFMITCPNCASEEVNQLPRSVENERYCTSCGCIWLYPEMRVLLTGQQIENIYVTELQDERASSYTPKKG